MNCLVTVLLDSLASLFELFLPPLHPLLGAILHLKNFVKLLVHKLSELSFFLLHFCSHFFPYVLVEFSSTFDIFLSFLSGFDHIPRVRRVDRFSSNLILFRAFCEVKRPWW